MCRVCFLRDRDVRRCRALRTCRVSLGEHVRCPHPCAVQVRYPVATQARSKACCLRTCWTPTFQLLLSNPWCVVVALETRPAGSRDPPRLSRCFAPWSPCSSWESCGPPREAALSSPVGVEISPSSQGPHFCLQTPLAMFVDLSCTLRWLLEAAFFPV